MYAAVEILGHALLFLLVFGMSATVDLPSVYTQMRNSRALAIGAFLQFVVLPFLGFVTVKMLGLDDAVGLTLLVVTSSPGGSFSNWWCSIFNADLALSVTMTALSTVLAVLMLPLNLAIYLPLVFNNGDDVNVFDIVDFGALVTSLVVVFSAIGLGILASGKVEHPKFHLYANRFGSAAGVSLVLLSGIVAGTVDGSVWARDGKFYFGIAFPCVVALGVSNLITTYAGLKKPERVTASIECCYQNTGIATSVALSMFAGQERANAMGVPFVYGLVEFAVIGMYSLGAWKAGWTKAPPSEPFWKMVTESYEVLLAEKIAGDEEGSFEIVEKEEGKDVEGGESACPYENADAAEEGADSAEKKQELGKEESFVLVSDMLMSARAKFWKGLGYNVEQ